MSALAYTIDPAHSKARFSVRHMGIAWIHGAFNGLVGTLTYDRENVAASHIEVEIAVASVDTGQPHRDEMIRGDMLLQVGAFPKMTFRTREVIPRDDGAEVRGDLTLHGVTREVVLQAGLLSEEVLDPQAKLPRSALAATTSLKRSDYGVTWTVPLENGRVLVGDDLEISLELEFLRGSPAA